MPITGLINRYIDFATTPTFNFTINASFTDNNFSTFRGLKYYLNTIGNVPFPPKTKLIDVNSNFITTGYTFSITNFVKGQTWGTNIQRKITQIGVYQEQIALFASIFANIGLIETDDQGADTVFSYVVLQQAVPVTIQRNPTTNVAIATLGNLQTITAVINTTYRLDKSQNRGDEASSTWTILKYDPTTNNTPVNAVQNVDYTLISGTLVSDVIDIQFLTNAFNFRVQNIVSGYTFSNNPFINTNSDTTINNAITSNDFLLVTTPIIYNITFPRLDISLTVPIEVTSVPFTTYQAQPITVQAVILNSTGVYNQVNGPTTTPLSLTDLEWQNEMTTHCNVILNITEKTTGNLVQTANGFGPFIVSLVNVDNYNFQYITTLK